MAQFTLPDRTKTKEMRYQMGFALADLANEFPRVLALDADLRSSTGLHIFEHFHPAKLIKTGIAEQNLVSMAAGLARKATSRSPAPSTPSADACSISFTSRWPTATWT